MAFLLMLLIFSNILEGSVDHIIYRDYIANRRSFIYCSLACMSTSGMEGGTGSKGEEGRGEGGEWFRRVG